MMTDEELITKMCEEEINLGLSRGIKETMKTQAELRASFRTTQPHMTDDEFNLWYDTPRKPGRCMCSFWEYPHCTCYDRSKE